MNAIEDKLHDHEVECAKRYGEFQVSIATLAANQAWLSKLIWFIIVAVLSFELNAIFKIVGHS